MRQMEALKVHWRIMALVMIAGGLANVIFGLIGVPRALPSGKSKGWHFAALDVNFSRTQTKEFANCFGRSATATGGKRNHVSLLQRMYMLPMNWRPPGNNDGIGLSQFGSDNSKNWQLGWCKPVKRNCGVKCGLGMANRRKKIERLRELITPGSHLSKLICDARPAEDKAAISKLSKLMRAMKTSLKK